ncbi:hypothetical protein HMPREF9709_01188 [Helcococcus kunzii ATCC 51366]|uniref:TP901-1 family phage major tail protein n=1 Tax=Helcococcus kunzii ATCC 51366 TaxID=883114 RepID=H3NPC7_9FIRM|nr:hypothetical protein [Helcococcus kunzii]EHR33440.1 hypothetical protein HMPREF9709_01188 [Helcococcus kunzii ATCC 51366]
MAKQRKLVVRARKVSYMNTGTQEVPVWTRMRGFTSLNKSKEALEYSRQYVDEYFETTDSVGMSEGIEFEFDQYTNDEPHKKIAKIFDDELVGDDANVEILTVDYSSMLTAESEMPKEYDGIQRTYTVIPDGEGDGTESYKYSGAFKAKTAIKKVKVTAPQHDKSEVVTIGTKEL